MKQTINILTILFITVFSVFSLVFLYQRQSEATGIYLEPRQTYWVIQSVDTMKSSRDLSRENLGNPSFAAEIDEYARKISMTGATHMAIGTPYDQEFYPVMKEWVDAARKYNLNVWFRGNWSGWEGWFDYPAINRNEHLEKTKDFIIGHPELFENGDNFTACPECENGGPGDPRMTGDVMGFRQFMLNENDMMKDAFNAIGRQVRYNLNSMNGDVARLVMDKDTTGALGGIVTIDHYVATPEQLVSDIKEISEQSGGRIVLGEFGVPIPDIHGKLTQSEQAQWLRDAFVELNRLDNIYGVNYWLGTGGSTELWTGEGVVKPAYYVLSEYYKPNILHGLVQNELYEPLPGALITFNGRQVSTNDKGAYVLRYNFAPTGTASIYHDGYQPVQLEVSKSNQRSDAYLIKEQKDVYFQIKEKINNWFKD